MEKKTSSARQNNQEEIRLLTFQPEEMLSIIEKLKNEVSSCQMEINILNLLITDLKYENEQLYKKSFRIKLQETLLNFLGARWEKDEIK